VIKLKRAYEPATPDDGARYLVERLWPRGVKKADLPIEAWLKDVAPSPSLRQWYQHDVTKWAEFRRRYIAELRKNRSALEPLARAAAQGTVTLVYSARDTEHNSAAVLRDYLEKEGK
jgi:uncharacterized protein YeaO (DUF488 family)